MVHSAILILYKGKEALQKNLSGNAVCNRLTEAPFPLSIYGVMGFVVSFPSNEHALFTRCPLILRV